MQPPKSDLINDMDEQSRKLSKLTSENLPLSTSIDKKTTKKRKAKEANLSKDTKRLPSKKLGKLGTQNPPLEQVKIKPVHTTGSSPAKQVITDPLTMSELAITELRVIKEIVKCWKINVIQLEMNNLSINESNEEPKHSDKFLSKELGFTDRNIIKEVLNKKEHVSPEFKRRLYENLSMFCQKNNIEDEQFKHLLNHLNIIKNFDHEQAQMQFNYIIKLIKLWKIEAINKDIAHSNKYLSKILGFGERNIIEEIMQKKQAFLLPSDFQEKFITFLRNFYLENKIQNEKEVNILLKPLSDINIQYYENRINENIIPSSVQVDEASTIVTEDNLIIDSKSFENEKPLQQMEQPEHRLAAPISLLADNGHTISLQEKDEEIATDVVTMVSVNQENSNNAKLEEKPLVNSSFTNMEIEDLEDNTTTSSQLVESYEMGNRFSIQDTEPVYFRYDDKVKEAVELSEPEKDDYRYLNTIIKSIGLEPNLDLIDSVFTEEIAVPDSNLSLEDQSDNLDINYLYQDPDNINNNIQNDSNSSGKSEINVQQNMDNDVKDHISFLEKTAATQSSSNFAYFIRGYVNTHQLGLYETLAKLNHPTNLIITELEKNQLINLGKLLDLWFLRNGETKIIDILRKMGYKDGRSVLSSIFHYGLHASPKFKKILYKEFKSFWHQKVIDDFEIDAEYKKQYLDCLSKLRTYRCTQYDDRRARKQAANLIELKTITADQAETTLLAAKANTETTISTSEANMEINKNLQNEQNTDHILANDPFMKIGTQNSQPSQVKAIAKDVNNNNAGIKIKDTEKERHLLIVQQAAATMKTATFTPWVKAYIKTHNLNRFETLAKIEKKPIITMSEVEKKQLIYLAKMLDLWFMRNKAYNAASLLNKVGYTKTILSDVLARRKHASPNLKQALYNEFNQFYAKIQVNNNPNDSDYIKRYKKYLDRLFTYKETGYDDRENKIQNQLLNKEVKNTAPVTKKIKASPRTVPVSKSYADEIENITKRKEKTYPGNLSLFYKSNPPYVIGIPNVNNSLVLAISKRRIEKLTNNYIDFTNIEITNFTDCLEKLLKSTNTKLRYIKSTESSYIKANYMVNTDNIQTGLPDLVKSNGIIIDNPLNKYYQVLTKANGEIIGHLVYYFDKEKMEITIPAMEIALAHRGKRLASIFILAVMSFAQLHQVNLIKLQTAAHDKAEHLKQDLTEGMNVFYTKHGWMPINENPESWYAKDFQEKLNLFHSYGKNKECVLNIANNIAVSLVTEEVEIVIKAYAICDSLRAIIEDHSKQFKSKSKYSVYDLLESNAYREWLKGVLCENNIFKASEIMTCLRILLFTEKSPMDLRSGNSNTLSPKDDTAIKQEIALATSNALNPKQSTDVQLKGNRK